MNTEVTAAPVSKFLELEDANAELMKVTHQLRQSGQPEDAALDAIIAMVRANTALLVARLPQQSAEDTHGSVIQNGALDLVRFGTLATQDKAATLHFGGTQVAPETYLSFLTPQTTQDDKFLAMLFLRFQGDAFLGASETRAQYLTVLSEHYHDVHQSHSVRRAAREAILALDTDGTAVKLLGVDPLAQSGIKEWYDSAELGALITQPVAALQWCKLQHPEWIHGADPKLLVASALIEQIRQGLVFDHPIKEFGLDWSVPRFFGEGVPQIAEIKSGGIAIIGDGAASTQDKAADSTTTVEDGSMIFCTRSHLEKAHRLTGAYRIAVFAYVALNPKSSSSDIAKGSGVDPKQVPQLVSRLKADGLLVADGEFRQYKYSIAPSILEGGLDLRKVFPGVRDRKLQILGYLMMMPMATTKQIADALRGEVPAISVALNGENGLAALGYVGTDTTSNARAYRYFVILPKGHAGDGANENESTATASTPLAAPKRTIPVQIVEALKAEPHMRMGALVERLGGNAASIKSQAQAMYADGTLTRRGAPRQYEYSVAEQVAG